MQSRHAFVGTKANFISQLFEVNWRLHSYKFVSPRIINKSLFPAGPDARRTSFISLLVASRQWSAVPIYFRTCLPQIHLRVGHSSCSYSWQPKGVNDELEMSNQMANKLIIKSFGCQWNFMENIFLYNFQYFRRIKSFNWIFWKTFFI